MRVLIFGDSVTQGLYDSGGGWTARLAGQLYAQDFNTLPENEPTSHIVFNLGIRSNMVKDVLERFTFETEKRLFDEEQVCIVLAVGLSDAALLNNRVVVDEHDFAHDYSRLIDMAQDYTPHVFCLGLTAVDEAVCEQWRRRRHGKTFTNNRVNLFEDCVKQAAFEKKAGFIKLHDEFLALQKKQGNLLASDGVHPDEFGHMLIAERVRQALETLL